MLDELYGELDELTSAAAKRHVAGCARCSARLGALRATRRLAAVPLVSPPDDLEDRILAAVDRAWQSAPRRRGVAHLVSLAGSWAMRPQTAMAAVFLVMIGTSVLLLRGKSGRIASEARVTVTERGTPAPAVAAAEPLTGAGEPRTFASNAPSPVGAAPPSPGALAELKSAATQGASPRPAAGAGLAAAPAHAHFGNKGARAAEKAGGAALDDESSGGSFDAAVQDFRAGRYADATREFDALAPSNPSASLWAARAVRESQGCAAATSRFDQAARQARQTPVGWDALLEGALCYRLLGDLGTARARLGPLLAVDSHKDRARAELTRIDALQQAQASASDAPAAKTAARARAAAATEPAAAAPAPNAAPPAGPAATAPARPASPPSSSAADGLQ